MQIMSDYFPPNPLHVQATKMKTRNHTKKKYFSLFTWINITQSKGIFICDNVLATLEKGINMQKFVCGVQVEMVTG